MKVTTRHFGDIEVDEKDLLTFPQGMVGFENHQRFAIIRKPDEEPFEWLQCITLPELAFVVVDPLLVEAAYNFEVDDDTIDLLQLKDPQDVMLRAIVTVRNDVSKMTANLLAPLVINKVEQTACQLILNDSNYSTRYPLFADNAATGS